MFKQEKTKIFTSNHGSTIILIDKSTKSSPKTEVLSLAKGKGWVIHSEDVPFNIFLKSIEKIVDDSTWSEDSIWWEETSLPEFNGEK